METISIIGVTISACALIVGAIVLAFEISRWKSERRAEIQVDTDWNKDGVVIGIKIWNYGKAVAKNIKLENGNKYCQIEFGVLNCNLNYAIGMNNYMYVPILNGDSIEKMPIVTVYWDDKRKQRQKNSYAVLYLYENEKSKN